MAYEVYESKERWECDRCAKWLPGPLPANWIQFEWSSRNGKRGGRLLCFECGLNALNDLCSRINWGATNER